MANPFSVQPLGGFQGVQNINQGMQRIAQRSQMNKEEEQQAAEQERQAAIQAEAQRLMTEGTPQEIAAFSAANPEIGKAMQGGVKFANAATEKNMQESMQRIVAGEDPAQVIQDRVQMVQANGGDPRQSQRELEVLQQVGPEQYRKMISNVYAMRYGTEGVPGMDGSSMPAGVREFNSMVESAGLEPGSEEYQRAALVSLGLEPRAGISASERIANDPALASRVADLERQTSQAKETGKLETQAQLVPGIRASIKEAEQKAQSRGEAASELSRAEAALPGLQEVVGKLVDLSDVATYTWGGRVFDTAMKELGFGATEGSTARAKMESLVNNQILPLLSDTFGAQFTEREGEQLRKTMLDINAAPAQKREILDSFLEQKMRDLETKRSQLESSSNEGSQMSEEEADALINDILEQ